MQPVRTTSPSPNGSTEGFKESDVLLVKNTACFGGLTFKNRGHLGSS